MKDSLPFNADVVYYADVTLESWLYLLITIAVVWGWIVLWKTQVVDRRK